MKKIYEQNLKGDFAISMPLKWTILMKIDHFPDGQFSFMKADALLYRIESFLNRIDIESKSNRIEN